MEQELISAGDARHSLSTHRPRTSSAPQLHVSGNHWGAADLQRVVATYETQITVVDAQSTKTIYAMERLAEMHSRGYLTLQDAISYMCSLDQTADLPGEADFFLAEARRTLILSFIETVQAAVQVGSRNVAIEIVRSLHPDAITPPKRGVLHRLIFGKDDRSYDRT